MLTEAFYILFFYFTGEFISYFIDGFIPGSVMVRYYFTQANGNWDGAIIFSPRVQESKT